MGAAGAGGGPQAGNRAGSIVAMGRAAAQELVQLQQAAAHLQHLRVRGGGVCALLTFANCLKCREGGQDSPAAAAGLALGASWKKSGVVDPWHQQATQGVERVPGGALQLGREQGKYIVCVRARAHLR